MILNNNLFKMRPILIVALLVVSIISGCKARLAFDSITIKTGELVKAGFSVASEFKGKTLILVDRTNCSNDPFRSTNTEPTFLTVKGYLIDYFNSEINARAFYTYTDNLIGSDAFCSNTPFPSPMSKNTVLEFIDNQEAVLLSLEKLTLIEGEDFRDEVESTYDRNNVLLSSRNVRIGRRTISGTMAIKFYNSTGNLLDSTIVTENYMYEVKATNQISAQRQLDQGRELALKNMGIKIGFKLAEVISPYYREVKRYYFAFSRYNTLFDEAYEVIMETNDWVTASHIWKAITESDSKDDDRAKAFFNLGVYYEKEGDYEAAKKMLEQSAAINNEVGGSYLIDLRARY
jgi:hypothetical protein